MKKLLIFIFLIYTLDSFSQYFQDEKIMDTSLISPWISNSLDNYEGVYFFGISEYESKAILSIDDKIVEFQTHSAGKEIYANGEFAGWERNIENYTNVKIIGSKFFSDQTNGEFTIYTYNNKKEKCLKLNTPPINVYNDEPELGSFDNKEKTIYISGNFPITKFDILPLEKLDKYSQFDLKIMRNEIFARYGYKFKAGGQMDKYFQHQGWYRADTNNVNNFLSNIEKKNIENIKSIESKKAHNRVARPANKQ